MQSTRSSADDIKVQNNFASSNLLSHSGTKKVKGFSIILSSSSEINFCRFTLRIRVSELRQRLMRFSSVIIYTKVFLFLFILIIIILVGFFSPQFQSFRLHGFICQWEREIVLFAFVFFPFLHSLVFDRSKVRHHFFNCCSYEGHKMMSEKERRKHRDCYFNYYVYTRIDLNVLAQSVCVLITYLHCVIVSGIKWCW